jgi:CRISPR-associated protein (TIGR02584 family)
MTKTPNLPGPGQDADATFATAPRRILVCVTGLSPQIVTETLYALCVQQTTPWIPGEVHLITTKRGAENARLSLLSGHPGWFHRFINDWKLSGIHFDAKNINVIHNRKGEPLDDIRNDEDNLCAADCIADLVRTLSEDENSEIHASIAGGRKSMGFFMGYAMSLWGRPQDRLSHVLVSSPFEARAKFFYPTPFPAVISPELPGQDSLDASNAKVWLGDIPFVRLRGLLPPTIKDRKSGFAQAVSAANRALDELELEIDTAASTVRINQQTVRLPPMQFGLLCLLAWRCREEMPPLPAPLKDEDDPEWRAEVRMGLIKSMGEMHIPGSLDTRLNSDEEPIGPTFSQQLSKMERALRSSGALPLRPLVVRQRVGNRGRQHGYSLGINASQVRFIKSS